MYSSHELKIVSSGDGSHTVVLPAMNESYHSRHGAWTESMHIFIEQGLRKIQDKDPVNIFEVGFGTGLNAFLTCIDRERPRRSIKYDSIDAFPLEKEIYARLNYPRNQVEHSLFLKLHDCAWNSTHRITEAFELRKIHSELGEWEFQKGTYDLVYYDAFAPSRQPEMWSLEILSKVFGALNTGGVLVTYCASGQLKRDLLSLGMSVETLEGPPGKKEMVRATKKH